VVAVLVVGAVLGLYWFQPWRLVTAHQVADPLSTPVATGTAGVLSRSGSPTPRGPTLLRTGRFVSHEHNTSGTARIVRNPDGTRQLELIGLDTSSGPDLRVWLTDQQVRESSAGWRVFDDGRYVELGRLKGNRGDQVYPIPGDVDVDGVASVSIWCKRFSVSYGAAPLSPV